MVKTLEEVLGKKKKYKVLKPYGFDTVRDKVEFAGNTITRIYGTLYCEVGRRMNAENRVFFESIEMAEQCGYKPCSVCNPKGEEI